MTYTGTPVAADWSRRPELLVYTCAGNNTGGAATAITCRKDHIFLTHGGGPQGTFPFDVDLIAMSVDISHSNGSDPGDWTFTFDVRNQTGTQVATETLTLTMDRTGYLNHNTSYRELTSPLRLTAGTDTFGARADGPACGGPYLIATFIFRRVP